MSEKILYEKITVLFNSKLKSYNELTVISWVNELKKYPLEKTLKAIDMVSSQDDFPSVRKVVNLIQPELNFKQKALDQWDEIKKGCCGDKNKPDKIAMKAFNMLSTFEEYGYSENDYFKERVRKDFLEIYERKAEEEKNRIMIQGKQQGLLNV